MKGTSLDDLHERWLKDPGYKQAYDDLEEEFSIAAALIEARSRAGLSQEEVARRMQTKQTVVARLESGRAMPSTRTLQRFAIATGTKLKISFDPKHAA
ncbi:MAG: helix-turn-helix transcriptional regulator [Desulfovibrionaceae bacterium]|nr:helix-turn-helix transcriptional regulator [Desulfovibrionaceae bacterium]MBF0513860.1 helix-turn-helix transcriptional regulator [Desulfovibrionaceae bacterium]